MKTNFHMMRDLDFKPQHFGVLTGEEVQYLRNHFELKARSNVELQNLRDFVVLYGASRNKDHNLEYADLISAITGVIDEEKWNRGLEV